MILFGPIKEVAYDGNLFSIKIENMKITYYQCQNADCGLRFPHHAEFNGRCPKCLDELFIKDSFEVPNENNDPQPSSVEHAIVLDNVRSGFNVGAMIRTAECLGIRKIALGGITPSFLDPTVRKTSLNAEDSIEFIKSNRTLDCVSQLRADGYQIWAVEITPQAENIFDLSIPAKKIALVVGNERCGVDPEIMKIADKVVMIPMYGSKRSLNVEVSLGIALGCLVR